MSRFTSAVVEPLYTFIYGQVPSHSIEERMKLGLVLVADGVGGLDVCGTGLKYMVNVSGLPCEVKVFEWGHGLGKWYSDLTDDVNRDQKAVLLAKIVRQFRLDRPGKPVFLVGKSGGSGVVVKAMECMEPGSVENVVLLAPALSPGYDLTGALCAVRGEAVVFWSPMDVFILGAGTWIFGTIDRLRSVGAGLVSFIVPGPDEPNPERIRQYAKLRQIRWNLGMATTGYLGGHFGPDQPRFLRKYVVPLLRAGGAGKD